MAVHKLSYRGTRRRFGLGAQMTARPGAEVADARLDQGTLRTFRATGSIVYRDRILAWHLDLDAAKELRKNNFTFLMAAMCSSNQVESCVC